MLHFTTFGKGPALLMIPGLACTPTFFRAIEVRLGRRYQVISVSLPGHGTSCDDPESISLESIADELRALILDLKLNDVSLLGWSLGASVAYSYLDRHCDARVGRLISVEQTPRLINDGDWIHSAFGTLSIEGVEQLTHQILLDYPGFARAIVGNLFAEQPDFESAIFHLLLAEVHRCEPRVVKQLFMDVVSHDWRKMLAGSSIPKLFIHGCRSKIYPTDLGRWWSSSSPNATVEVFTQSGHLPFLEEPEKFAQTVDHFIHRTRN